MAILGHSYRSIKGIHKLYSKLYVYIMIYNFIFRPNQIVFNYIVTFIVKIWCWLTKKLIFLFFSFVLVIKSNHPYLTRLWQMFYSSNQFVTLSVLDMVCHFIYCTYKHLLLVCISALIIRLYACVCVHKSSSSSSFNVCFPSWHGANVLSVLTWVLRLEVLNADHCTRCVNAQTRMH